MTRATHTPGPMTQGASSAGKTCVWLGGATEPPHEMGPDTTWIDCNTEANARRIAACWNACEGLDTGLLKNITHWATRWPAGSGCVTKWSVICKPSATSC